MMVKVVKRVCDWQLIWCWWRRKLKGSQHSGQPLGSAPVHSAEVAEWL